MANILVRLASTVLFAMLVGAATVTAQDKRPVDPDVVFNTQSLIYHRATCSAAQRCTRNCVVVRLSEARQRGGRPCKTCGGAPQFRSILLTENVRITPTSHRVLSRWLRP